MTRPRLLLPDVDRDPVARLASERADALQGLGTALADAFTREHVAQVIASHTVDALGADAGAVFELAESRDALRPLAAIGYGAEVVARFPSVPLTLHYPATETARTLRPRFIPSRVAWDAVYSTRPSATSRGSEDGAWATLPLEIESDMSGVLVLAFAAPRAFDADDRAFMSAFAALGAQALGRARLLDGERRLRSAAEANAARVSELQGLTTALASAVTPEDVAEVALERARPAFGAMAGLFNLVSDDRREFVQLRTSGLPASVSVPWQRYPVDAGTPGSEVVATGDPVFVSSYDEADRRFPVLGDNLRRAGCPSFACLPMTSGGVVLGIVAFNFATERAFGDAEREQMRAFAGQCALALARARLYDAEREARASAEELSDRLGDILETMSDALFEYDREWRLARVNAAARVTLRADGIDPSAALGRTLWELTPDAQASAHEEQFRRAMAGERVRFRTYHATRARWIEMRAYPTRTGIAAYARDVDVEVRAEERLRMLADAGRVLAAALDPQATLDAIGALVVPAIADGCTIDLVRDGVMDRVVCIHRIDEKAELLAESARRNPSAFSRMAPQMFERLSAGRGILIHELRPEAFDAMVPDPYQRDAIVRVGIQSYILVPMRIGDRLLGAMGLIISESARRYDEDDLGLAEELAWRSAIALENARLYGAERAARADAEAANRAKMEFLTTMSHELRTPLNAIGGHAQLIQLGIHGPVSDDQLDALSRIQSSQAHLLGLINDVLNFAKLDAGKVEFQIAEVALEPLVASVAGLVAPQFAAKSIHYGHACSCDGDPCALADADKVRQIVLNLLSNAAKFTPRGGTVSVRCQREGPIARIVVSDTGIGIPADKLDHIFEPFVQVGRSLSTRHEGTGLGLAISRELARGMGGELTVESVQGEGSTFTLRLPAPRA